MCGYLPLERLRGGGATVRAARLLALQSSQDFPKSLLAGDSVRNLALSAALAAASLIVLLIVLIRYLLVIGPRRLKPGKFLLTEPVTERDPRVTAHRDVLPDREAGAAPSADAPADVMGHLERDQDDEDEDADLEVGHDGADHQCSPLKISFVLAGWLDKAALRDVSAAATK